MFAAEVPLLAVLRVINLKSMASVTAVVDWLCKSKYFIPFTAPPLPYEKFPEPFQVCVPAAVKVKSITPALPILKSS